MTRLPLQFVPLLLSLGLVGCGGGVADRPDLGRVSGTVTLDKKPLPNAAVEFQPESGRPSSGITDEAGKYDLDYTRDVKGAKVGKHKVRIRTYKSGDDDGEGAVPEKVPDTYNDATTLEEEVKAGSQTIDFELDSGSGVIIQPDAEDAERTVGC